MTRTVAIEQPNYIPWIGYFDLIRQSDIWVWYDDVQYTKRDWRNRNLVALEDERIWITIPVKTKGRYAQAIREVEIDYSQPWRRRHVETVRRCYSRAPFFTTVVALIEEALEPKPNLLADLTIGMNEAICARLGFGPHFVRSSMLPSMGADRVERLIEICRGFESTTYLSGPSARAYIDPRVFARAGIELRYIVYDYPEYARGAHAFVRNLSIIDALAWLGPSNTAAFLDAHGRSEREEIAC